VEQGQRLSSSFGAAATEYAEHRPDYAEEAVRWALAPAPGPRVLDLGAGTGKLTAALVAAGADVVAVEPDPEMLAELRRGLPDVPALSGSAEVIPLPDASVDAVFVAEAFHWFDLERAPAEIARVLRPGGGLAILWNRPGATVEWVDEVYETLKAHRREHTRMPHQIPWRESLEAVFGPLALEEVDNEHVIDPDLMIANLASHSSIGSLPPDRLEAALAAAREVIERHGIGRVAIPLRTHIYTAQKRSGDSGPSAG
jgi:SAM-dependent methyltransferase